jgi:short-subunit dehydrogenase
MLKTVVIVGASKGIGAELMESFASIDGFRVFGFARNMQLQREKWSLNPLVHCLDIDLTSENLQFQILDVLKNEKVDFLINNAGLLVNKPFMELTPSDILESYKVNVLSVFTTIQAILPLMNNQGHIVNISSMGGFQGTMKFAGLAAYSSSKAALVNLTEMLAEEYKHTQLKFNCLCLGAVQTEMLQAAFPGYEAPVQPAEMAEYISDFTRNAWRWMNGKVIPVSLSTP